MVIDSIDFRLDGTRSNAFRRADPVNQKGETNMYTVSDIVEMGEAHKLVLDSGKEDFVLDDSWPQSMIVDESFDQ